MKPLDLSTLLNIPELPGYLARVKKDMESWLAPADPAISRPLKRIVASKGKGFRSALAITVVVSQGAKVDKKVISACAALEMVHTGSLVHDDVIDNSDTRRGTATINSKEGINSAILVGDYLLAKACLAAADVSSEAAKLIAEAIARLCDGESRELADRFNTSRSQQSLIAAIEAKTGALLSAACALGGLCAGLNKRQAAALADYGQRLGMAFQLIDDALDFVSTSQLIGKPTAGDIREGVYTLPVILALQSSDRRAAKSYLADAQKSRSSLTKLLLAGGYIQKSLFEAKKYNRLAAKALQPLAASGDISALLSLPDAYLNWALANLTAPAYRAEILKVLV